MKSTYEIVMLSEEDNSRLARFIDNLFRDPTCKSLNLLKKRIRRLAKKLLGIVLPRGFVLETIDAFCFLDIDVGLRIIVHATEDGKSPICGFDTQYIPPHVVEDDEPPPPQQQGFWAWMKSFIFGSDGSA